MITQFNIWHFVLLGSTLALFIALTLFFGLFLRKKNPRISKYLIAVFFLAGLVLHFLRLAFPPAGRTFPEAYQYITPMSVSAFIAIFALPIYLWGSRAWKDFIFYIGIITGIIALFLPVTAIGKPAASFDVIRFFVLHGINCFAPLMMVLCGHHKLNWRRAWVAPFMLIAVLCVIILNEIFLTATGIVDQDMTTLLSNTERNGAMIFGPEPSIGAFNEYFNALCPKVFKTALYDIPAIGIKKGETYYWPVLWITIPGLVFFIPLCFLLSLAFDYRRFWRDLRWLGYTLTGNKEKKQLLGSGRKLSKLKRRL